MVPITALTRHLQEAFRTVNRSDFLPLVQRPFAELDKPLPIGYGQTNSQPSTVAFMLELLHLKPGLKVLDVGSGSGWTTALIAQIVGPLGKVSGVELVPELVAFGNTNLHKYSFSWAEIYPAGTRLGLPEQAPFDRILVSAAATELPSDLVEQLAADGVMVVPVGWEVFKITRQDGELRIECHPGFAFVPLVHKPSS